MATKTRKSSPSNMAERKPIQGKGKANVIGAIGLAAAAVCIQEAEAHAKAEQGIQATRKERLGEMTLFSQEDHLAYRGELDKRIKQVQDAADAVKMTLTAYRDANPESSSVYQELTMWRSLSVSVGKGWTPNLTETWAQISKAATLARNSTGKPDPALVEQLQSVRQDPKMPEKQKTAIVKELAEQINASIIPAQADPTARTTGRGRPANVQTKPMWDLVLPIIKDRPIQDVESLVAQLVTHCATVQGSTIAKVLEAVHEKLTRRAVPATPSARAKAPTRGAKSEGTIGEKEQEHATAKGNKRSRK